MRARSRAHGRAPRVRRAGCGRRARAVPHAHRTAPAVAVRRAHRDDPRRRARAARPAPRRSAVPRQVDPRHVEPRARSVDRGLGHRARRRGRRHEAHRARRADRGRRTPGDHEGRLRADEQRHRKARRRASRARRGAAARGPPPPRRRRRRRLRQGVGPQALRSCARAAGQRRARGHGGRWHARRRAQGGPRAGHRSHALAVHGRARVRQGLRRRGAREAARGARRREAWQPRRRGRGEPPPRGADDRLAPRAGAGADHEGRPDAQGLGRPLEPPRVREVGEAAGLGEDGRADAHRARARGRHAPEGGRASRDRDPARRHRGGTRAAAGRAW